MLEFTEILDEKLTLQYHPKLNQKLWNGESLKADVRTSLLKIAAEWQKFARIPNDLVQDVIMTGGNCQFNYTKFSDIDLHILMDRSKLFDKKEYVDEYLGDKKSLWSLSRNVKIKGFTVELYAQDINDKLVASGVYSLQKNKWIQKPVHGKYNFKHDDALEAKVTELEDTIESMIEKEAPERDFKIMKDKLKNMRNAALASGDEFTFDNLVFKELRNRKVLDKMNKYLQNQRDKELSLT